MGEKGFVSWLITRHPLAACCFNVPPIVLGEQVGWLAARLEAAVASKKLA